MSPSIQFMRSTLSAAYPETEIEGFISLILENICGISRTERIANPGIKIPDGQKSKIELIIRRLLKYEPIQYIFGKADFYGLIFNVGPQVLIPRGETEELVDMIIAKYRGQNLKILDLGTGSGCIAVTLQKNMPDSECWACDITQESLDMARTNAELNGVKVHFFRFDILEEDLPENLPDFNLMVSNPPYVTWSERVSMPANVLDNEPDLALFVPDHDPLLFYRSICHLALKKLLDGGTLFFEINEAYGKETIELLQQSGFEKVELFNDIHGKNRMVIGTLNKNNKIT